MLTKTTTLIGAFVTFALLVAYVLLTVLNHDGTPILTLLAGWVGGASIAPVTSAVTKGDGA